MMRRWRDGLFGLAFSCFFGLAQAADAEALARITARVGQPPVIRAEFVQTRQMVSMKRPLTSSGRLTYSRKHGVLWQIEQPYRMSYILSDERIVEIASDGSRKERSARDVPGLAQVGRVFRAMLGANTAALQDYFDATVQGDNSAWTIVLKPRQAQLAQFLSGMQIAGSQFVDSITISEAGGDSSNIRFRNTQGVDAPNTAELKLFGAENSGSGASPAASAP